jgi:hypothetical protein
MFFVLTVACFIFALIGQFGIDGFFERVAAALFLASPLFPAIRFYSWWKRNVGFER